MRIKQKVLTLYNLFKVAYLAIKITHATLKKDL